MSIDVIIPTFNRARIVSNAIESVLDQTYANFKLHLVDDGSTDNTVEILERYSTHPNVKIYIQNNKGVSSARNLAAFEGNNKWISFLDSDDFWMPNKLEIQLDYLKKNTSCRFLHSEELWIRNGIRVNPKQKYQKSNENIFERSLDFCLISPSTVILRRDLFIEKKGFDESLVVCEDFDLWLKILSTEENIGFISRPLIEKHGGHADQLSTKFVAMDYWRIKSLVNLYNLRNTSDEKKKLIKEVILKKSELLLKNYLKYQNQKSYDEISLLISTVFY